VSLAGLLDTTVAIHRATEKRSPAGVSTATFALLTSGVRTSIQRARGRRVQLDPGAVVDAEFTAFFEAGTDVKEGDRVVEGARTYDVLLLDRVRGHHLEAVLALTAVV
jgi:hypothetical protein